MSKLVSTSSLLKYDDVTDVTFNYDFAANNG